jgi:DivIVA domain-containing protein
MIDESFHLTPLDVRRFEFATSLRGYEKARVDQFREQVAEELERLTRLNQELEAKGRNFHEQLRAYRDRDRALNEALVSAQQLRAEIREQAERDGQLLLREAKAEADRILAEATAAVRRMEEQLEQLQRTKRVYLTQLRSLAERHLAEVEAELAQPSAGAEATAVPRASESWMDGDQG